jgi:iron complex outermembrane receptor protein
MNMDESKSVGRRPAVWKSICALSAATLVTQIIAAPRSAADAQADSPATTAQPAPLPTAQNAATAQPAPAPGASPPIAQAAAPSAEQSATTAQAGAPPSAAQTAPAPKKSTADDDKGSGLEEVVVTGIRASLQSSLEVKRDALQVVDAISAEDIGQFPDKNLGEALQRVTGVQISRQDGEGRGVSIRGAAPGLNRVEVNGSSVLSLTVGGGRDVDFRDLPVEFISRLEVVKSATPDMTEGGVGGTVRIVTRRPFDSKKPYLAGSAQMVYSDLAKEYDPKFALIGSRTFLDDTLGVLLAATYEQRHLNNNESRTTGWVQRAATDTRAGGLNTSFLPDIPREGINRRETDRPAFNSIVEWKPTDNLNLYAEGTYARAHEDVASQYMQLSGSTGTVDPTKTVLGADNTVLHYEVVDSPASRLALAYRNILGDLQRTEYTTALGGTFDRDQWTFDGKVTYANGKVVNNEKNSTATIMGLQRAIVDYNNPQHAPNFTFPGIDTTTSDGVTQLDAVFNPRTNIQDEKGAKFNITYRPEWGWDWLTALKTGVEYRKLNMDQKYFGETVTLNGLTNPALLPQIRGIIDQYSGVNDIQFFETGDLGYGGGVRYWLDNRYDTFNATGNPTPYDTPRYLDTWGVEEKTKSAYVQGSFGFPDWRYPMDGVVGVRMVDTDTLSTGYNQINNPAPTPPTIVPGEQAGGYTKYLPSLNLVFKLVPDKLQARVTAGKVMARADPQQLALRQSLDTALAAGAGSRGNPDLQPFEATDYDAGVEWYLSNQNYVSATYFRKEISSFIQTTTTTERIDGRDFTISQPQNGTDKVTINGIEAGGQYAFDFLPRPFNGFGALANVTYAKDQGYKEVDFFTKGSLPFPGLSKTSYNTSLYFENQRFSVRASYNWRSKYLITPRGRGNNPEFGEAYGQLDANASLNITENATVFIEGINLLDNVRIEDANSELRRTIIETFGKRYFAGIRVKM